MGLFTNFKLGAKSFGEAHRFIKKHRLWGYVFLPALINICMIILLVIGGWSLFSWFTNWIFDITGLSAESDGWWSWLLISMKVIIRILLQIALFFLYSAIFRYIILAVLSPALALLSEKTEKLITGKDYPFHFGRFLTDVWRGIRIALRNSFIEFGLIILGWFISYIPVIGWFVPLVLFIIGCYFYGFSMIDYTNERFRLKIKGSIRFIRKNMGLSIANGMIFYLVFFFIPVIGLLIAPAYAVVAATIAVLKIQQPELFPEILKPVNKT